MGETGAERTFHRAFVTGGAGFVGSHVVRRILADGIPVRALVRRGTDPSNLEGLDLDLREGDIRDPGALESHLEGCDVCVHAAASYSLPEPAELYRVNVEGTRNVLEAAARAGLSALVHVSTIGTLGFPGTGSLGTVLPEDASDYVRSKLQGETLALEFAARGLPVVVVHPAAPVGPGDLKPTVTGRRILAVLRSRVPTYARGAINHVPVRDVADGIVRAARQGRAGRRYILGSSGGNLKLAAFVRQVERAAGPAHPGLSLARIILTRIRRRLAPARGVPGSLACDPARSLRELGVRETSLEEAFAEAVAWFRRRGMA